jgi:hypothetical protein
MDQYTIFNKKFDFNGRDIREFLKVENDKIK